MAGRAKATTHKINAVTKRLLGHYTAKKDRESKQKKYQKEFFGLLTELVRVDPETTLARKTVEVPEYYFEYPETYAETYYPEWNVMIVDTTRDKDGKPEAITVTLEENPEYKAATWVNAAIGVLFAKQVRMGSPMLDDERLLDQDPWLYNDLMERTWQLKPLGELDSDTLSKLQTYVYRGKPTLALQSPREATQEELADA